jgi:ATP-dependent Clp protease ATP-binding subunit ClpA
MKHRFTEPARRALLQAQHVAVGVKQTEIDSNHLLSALLGGDRQELSMSSASARILEKQGITFLAILEKKYPGNDFAERAQRYQMPGVCLSQLKSLDTLADPELVARILSRQQEREPEKKPELESEIESRDEASFLSENKLNPALVEDIASGFLKKLRDKKLRDAANDPEPILSDQVKRIIAMAAEEAKRTHLKDGTPCYIGTEHLLLGLLRDRECEAAQLLSEMGLEFDRAKLLVDDYLQAQDENEQAA